MFYKQPSSTTSLITASFFNTKPGHNTARLPNISLLSGGHLPWVKASFYKLTGGRGDLKMGSKSLDRVARLYSDSLMGEVNSSGAPL